MGFRGWVRTAAAVVALWASARSSPAGDVPWLAEVQQAPVAENQTELRPLLAGDAPLDRARWEQRRGELRDAWLTFLGPMSRRRLERDVATAPPTTLLHEEVVDGIHRQLISYEVEPEQAIEAYVLWPEGLKERAPGVVVFHSTVPSSLRQPAGVEGAPEKAFGLQLAKRGGVAICPRNYLWPESHRIDAKGEAAKFLERNPDSKGMDRMLADGLAAVDLLVAHSLVDSERIGCIGHSLGAKEALYLAAFDERVQAAVSSEGGIGTKFSNWHDAWYLGTAIQQADFALEHHELLALVAPRPFLLVGGDSADGDQSWPFIAAALPVYRLYGEPARAGLLNHKQGHSVPAEANEKMLAWITTYLGR
jgi:dienelactone hydrolase